MNKIIKVYLKNVFSQKSFYICLSISILMAVILPMITENLLAAEAKSTVSGIILPIFSLGVDMTQVIFITLFVCHDFTDGAVKNYISRGYTRKQILLSKFIVSLIAVSIFLIVECTLAFILFSKNGIGFTTNNLISILGCLVSIVATVELYVVISNIVEKVGTAMMINLLLPSFLSIIFLILNKVLNLKFNLSNYFVTNLPTLMNETPKINELLLVTVISIIYLIIIYIIGNNIIKKKEIK